MTVEDSRGSQRYPVLTEAMIEVVRRFAACEPHRFSPGDLLYDIGQRDAPVWMVLEGSVDLDKHNGLGRGVHVVIRSGQFSGELNQLAGYGAMAAARAGPDGCLALPLDAAHLRGLLIGSSEIGELFMRALILRRVALIENQFGGAVLVGSAGDGAVVRLQGFLTRNGYPNTHLDPASDGAAGALVQKLRLQEKDLPLIVCPNGQILRDPTDLEAARCLGLTLEVPEDRVWDVAVTGAGPAGLAAAVYAASEGLSVLVLDQRAIGGQAGASARIENYLGFPTGVSGQALAGRAFSQALKFGVRFLIPTEVSRLTPDPEPGLHRLELASGGAVRARTVVVASGARYRRPPIDGLIPLEGEGVSYWASAIEAAMGAGGEVGLVGAGNSAGQAIDFLAGRASRVHVFVRGADLASSMSRYLIDRIGARPNVQIYLRTTVSRVRRSEPGLLELDLVGPTDLRRLDVRHLFVFAGADPNTAWLRDCVTLDRGGFVPTGCADGDPGLQTSRPGIFAIGDVRAGSTKRIAAAVGEGAAVVAQIHARLSDHDETAKGALRTSPHGVPV